MSLPNFENSDTPASRRSSNITNSSNYSSKISDLVDQAHSINTLHLLSAFCQIVLGITVVLVSILGLIQPLWFSTALSMFASVATMLGIYFLYSTIARVQDPHKLLGDAIRRVIDAQN